MIFGDAVRSATSAEPAAWLSSERTGEFFTVGWLVPDRYESIVRVAANEPGEHWWEGYRELHRAIVEVARRHTSTPERAWLAIWEGHGFTSWSAHVAWRDPPVDEAEGLARDAERERVADESRREKARIAAALGEIAAFDAPERRYYLLTGPVDAVLELRHPVGTGAPNDWHHPDLWWPDDRRWFVATDVDVWSLYVAGDEAFVGEVMAAVPTQTEPVASSTWLVGEDE